ALVGLLSENGEKGAGLAVTGGIDVRDVRFGLAVAVEVDKGDARIGRLAASVDGASVRHGKARLCEELDRLFRIESGSIGCRLGVCRQGPSTKHGRHRDRAHWLPPGARLPRRT